MRLPDRQRSHAVLIGTGRYADGKLPDLPVVHRTISDLAATLTDTVYGVVLENYCTVLEDQADIRLIGRALRSAAGQAEDLLLVYFVGHGLVAGRRHELYLGLPDSEWGEPEFNSLEYDKLRSAVLDSAAATKIIILDCCFSGRVVSEAMADPVTEMVGQIEVAGTRVLASAGRDQVALIQPGEDHTAFTGRFLHMLRNGVPGGPELLTVDYLYRQLVMRMKAEGLSQPQKRGTSTVDLLALAGNRAFAAAGQHLGNRRQDDTPRGTSPPNWRVRDGDGTLLPFYLDPMTKLFLVALIWCRPWLDDPSATKPLPRTPEIARGALEVIGAHHELERFDADPEYRDLLSARVAEHIKVLRRKLAERGLAAADVRLSDEVAVRILIEHGVITSADLSRLDDPAWRSPRKTSGGPRVKRRAAPR